MLFPRRVEFDASSWESEDERGGSIRHTLNLLELLPLIVSEDASELREGNFERLCHGSIVVISTRCATKSNHRHPQPAGVGHSQPCTPLSRAVLGERAGDEQVGSGGNLSEGEKCRDRRKQRRA